MNSNSLVAKVRNIKNLREAWRIVRSSASKSTSNRIRQQALEYDKEIDKHLKRIQRQLSENRFIFEPAFGLAKEDKPGKKRPIVLAPIESRIVQRAILNILQSIPTLKQLFEIPTSCGGIADRGVRYAIDSVYKKMMSDGKYFIRSDIKSFFTKIPKNKVVGTIKQHTKDEEFITLLESALEVVLLNGNELGSDALLFPGDDIGVAQGSCLSPLMGNILLHEFDNELNSPDVLCIRYIDDFIIIGPDKKSVSAKLKKGNKILSDLGLDAYDPAVNPEKAEQGETTKGLGFLGCDVRPGMITPIKASRTRLIKKVQLALNSSVLALRNNKFEHPIKDKNFLDTISLVHNTVKAWGNQYQFCNNYQLLNQLDEKISNEISKYINLYSEINKKLNGNIPKKRRLLGIHALIDSKKAPIISA